MDWEHKVRIPEYTSGDQILCPVVLCNATMDGGEHGWFCDECETLYYVCPDCDLFTTAVGVIIDGDGYDDSSLVPCTDEDIKKVLLRYWKVVMGKNADPTDNCRYLINANNR